MKLLINLTLTLIAFQVHAQNSSRSLDLSDIRLNNYYAYVQNDPTLWKTSVESLKALLAYDPDDPVILSELSLAQIGLLTTAFSQKDESLFNATHDPATQT